jgi:hypothetical protein
MHAQCTRMATSTGLFLYYNIVYYYARVCARTARDNVCIISKDTYYLRGPEDQKAQTERFR